MFKRLYNIYFLFRDTKNKKVNKKVLTVVAQQIVDDDEIKQKLMKEMHDYPLHGHHRWQNQDADGINRHTHKLSRKINSGHQGTTSKSVGR